MVSFALVMSLHAESIPEEDAALKRIEAARKIDVPLPAKTPFDADPKEREVYLQEYRSAYRLVLAMVQVDCHMGVKGYYEKAFQQGWKDGRDAAMNAHPEKVAATYGISLSEYLAGLETLEAAKKKMNH